MTQYVRLRHWMAALICSALVAAAAHAIDLRPLVDPGSLLVRGVETEARSNGVTEHQTPGPSAGRIINPIRERTSTDEGGVVQYLGFAGPVLSWSAWSPSIGACAEFETRYSAQASSYRWGDALFGPDIQDILGAIAIEVREPIRIRLETTGRCSASGDADASATSKSYDTQSIAGGMWSAELTDVTESPTSSTVLSIGRQVMVTELDEKADRDASDARYAYLSPGLYVLKCQVSAFAGGFGTFPSIVLPDAKSWTTVNLRVLASCPADLDRDGRVTLEDLAIYLERWSAAKPEADLSGSTLSDDRRYALPDGRTDMTDLSVYLTLWFGEGCLP